MTAGFYMQYLESLCRRRGWSEPMYEAVREQNGSGYTALVLVNGREYQTDMAYESDVLAQENAAMRAFILCRNFSVNGGMLARNGVVQGLPADEASRRRRRGRSGSLRSGHHHSGYSHGHAGTGRRSAKSSSSSSSTHSSSSSSSDWSSSSFSSGPSRASRTSRYSTNTSPPDNLKQPEHQDYGDMMVLSNIDPASHLPKEWHEGESISKANLDAALCLQDRWKVRYYLEHHFRNVAVGEYSWMSELRELGCDPTEIADELLEKKRYGPWIIEPTEAPDTQPFLDNFHMGDCPHSPNALVEHRYQGTGLSFRRQHVDYFCGLGGARPAADGTPALDIAAVVFAENNSMATVTHVNPEEGVSVQVLLDGLERAARALQDLGGCCDSFTFLYEHENCLELHRVKFSLIRRLRERMGQKPNPGKSPGVLDFISQILPWINEALPLIDLDSDPTHLYALTAQFLSLAMLSYAQAHCGPIRPYFLDTPLKCIVLTGRNSSELQPGLLCCVGSLAELTCMGDMTGQPVFAFRFLTCVDKTTLPTAASRKFDLIASPEDILDTWGPGHMTRPESVQDSGLILAVTVGGGVIVPVERKDSETIQLHWSTDPGPASKLQYPFDRDSKYTIGTTLIENTLCRADSQVQLRNAVPMLEDMGTFSSYWDISERQVGVGLQAGQAGLATFQLSQTWVKMAGITKKTAILIQQGIHLADLESLYGVKVSVCTGIAQRVRIRDLLADLLPAYVTGLVTKPRLWASLLDDHDMLLALREHDLGAWLGTMGHEHQAAFEQLVFAVLVLLRDTGIDRAMQTFAIACIQPELPFRCFKVPCKKENYWARMLTDSEDAATFAYITTQCLETHAIRCSGLEGAWANSTALLSTEVSCYDERVAALSSRPAAIAATCATQWALKDSEAYLIGKHDNALFVKVDKANEKTEPRLLVSLSTIPPAYLYRFYRRGRPGKPRRLKEKKAFDELAESCVVLVGRNELET